MHLLANKSFRNAIVFVLLIAFSSSAWASKGDTRVRIESYFDVTQYSDVAISNGGEFVAVAGWKQDLATNHSLYSLYIYVAKERGFALVHTAAGKAQYLEWHPNRKRLYYVADDANGVSQIFQREFPRFRERQVTDDPAGVVDFKVSPNGKQVVWRTVSGRVRQARPGLFVERAGVYEDLQHGEEGYFVDPEYDALKTFINPDRLSERRIAETKLKLSSLERINASVLDAPEYVRGYEWSPDSNMIALTHIELLSQDTPFWASSSYVSLYDLKSDGLRSIASAALPTHEGAVPDIRNLGPSYSFGPWAPNSSKLMILRPITRNPTVVDTSRSNIEWTLFDVSRELLEPESVRWRPTYIFRDDSKLHSTLRLGFVSAKIANGAWGVWRFDEHGLTRVEVPGIDGAITNIYSSIAGTDHALVVESTGRAPEIYVSDLASSSTRVTEHNSRLPKFVPSEAKKVWWRSSDGEIIGGWFLDARQTAASGQDKTQPAPLITYVHGGPGGDVPNGFSDIGFDGGSSGRGKWAYPFEVLASEGISVFFPNYRPNPTYHMETDTDVDPKKWCGLLATSVAEIDDILSGIEFLIDNGYADADRLGLAGHSYGGVLGPKLLQLTNNFEVASFAEGSSNEFNRYIVNPGLLAFNGGPEAIGVDKLVEDSPEFHFEGIDAAILFESGARSGITGYMGAIKAARRANIPSELILYPRAEHNTVEPAIQYSVAENNYDWFKFWLQGYEDPDPEKDEQYDRWRKMRNESCANWKAEKKNLPTYCSAGSASMP